MRTTRIAAFLVLGLMLIATALLAESIGLDKDPGWGKGRIGLLLLGITSLGLAYYSYSESVQSILKRTQLFIDRTANRQNTATSGAPIRSYRLAILFLLFVWLFYIWFVSSGRWNSWKSPTYYYDALAEGFLTGHLYLPIQPDPRLLALKNPYDPLERTGVESPVDLSLYDGKFYMYWGLVPAMIPAIVQVLSGVQMGDMILALVFVCGIFLIQTLLLLTIWNRYLPTLPPWTLHLMILLCGLTDPLVLLRHNYDSARIYETAIAAGQFFLLAGFLTALTAMTKDPISNGRLATAGILWTLAIGSRQLLVAPISLMVILLAWLLLRKEMDAATRIKKYIYLGVPFVLGFVGLSWYNWARFGSITETGLYYQLAGPNLREHYDELFSLSYAPQNIFNFLFNPIDVLPKFPFVFMQQGFETAILPFYRVPEFYTAQPVAGVVFLFPFIVFAIISLTKAFSYLFKNKAVVEDSMSDDSRRLAWILLSLGGAALVAFIVSTMFFWVGMRYAADFLPALTILSCIGFWQGYQSLKPNCATRLFYALLGIILAGTSIVSSVLLAISTNSRLVNYITRIFPALR